ncbi:MAG: C-GCAxxG-C-C family protein [Pirellulaceae bacterium]
MKRVTRRDVLASLGVVGGTSLLAGCDVQSETFPREEGAEWQFAGSGRRPQSQNWVWVELDQGLVAKKAYELFPHGGCMYGITGSIVTTLSEIVGEPYRSFPFQMMQYGAGGTGGWGTICGALNGAAAVIGLVHAKHSDRMQAKQETPAGPRPLEAFSWYRLIEEVFRWYETAELPKYREEESANPSKVPPSVSGSVLCHVSLSNWSNQSGHKPFTPQMKERCRRLTADVARKTVDVLNRDLKGECFSGGLAPEVKSCIACHGKQDRADSIGKMSCTACHKLPNDHPEGR